MRAEKMREMKRVHSSFVYLELDPLMTGKIQLLLPGCRIKKKQCKLFFYIKIHDYNLIIIKIFYF